MNDDDKDKTNAPLPDPASDGDKSDDVIRLGQHEEANTSQTPDEQPYNQGEQSISGSTPEPESDDDTLQNAQNVGQQLDEDTEHPEELDIARDIDKGEEELRNQ